MVAYKILLTFLLSSVALLPAFSQAAMGEWIDYQSYAHAQSVADAGEKIYCVTEGGLFSFNKTDNSIQKISGINGLSDAGVQRLAYNKKNNVLLITYQNANIDVLIGTDVFNLSDIKRKQIPANKTINNVLFIGDLAYLSCGFGIVVVNLTRKEIKDTYFIGQEGAYMNVQDLASDGTYLYAATTNGIYKALLSAPNLQNFNNWIKQTAIPHADSKFSKIEEFKGKIIANFNTDNDAWDGDELYIVNETAGTRVLPIIKYVTEMTSNGNSLIVSGREEIHIFDENYNVVKHVPKSLFAANEEESLAPKDAMLDDQNVLWIADKNNGLIKLGAQPEKIVPEGPIDNMIFSLFMNEKDLWVSSGGRTNAWGNLYKRPQIQLNREGHWTVFDSKVFPVPNGFSDIVAVAIDPKAPDHVFAGSWGGGVLEIKDGKFVARYDNSNSTLQTQLPANPNEPYVRVGGLDFDSKGNLWVTNSGVTNVLSVLKTDGKWQSFYLEGFTNNSYVGKVLVTQNDDKWVITGRGQSIYVLNSTNEVAKEQNVTAYFSNLEVEVYTKMNDVNAIAEDQNGELWIGTSGGVAVFTNPKSIWEDKPMYAIRPGLNENDGNFHPLLEREIITAITVDGANRKWIGTRHSGVFLISADGESEIGHFTTENSPLPANDISDIAINQHSGEVFIGTGAGLISYMGQATKGTENYNDVYVYPNPVRETYDGPIVIKGLLEDTDIKITDVSGNLVYQATSLGGQAIWDGKTQNGNRCKTGVYLVFMNDATGETTKVTKLLFIH
ncbi:MAG: T9SS type A sorting domain-containing protein [Verrucomicrobia bacterium]|nr:T9SS type A sorting domain-containing protein [Prolixibacteraceae bacterium]